MRPDNATNDHVIPRSRGGRDALINLVRCCMRCNQDKANRLPSEWIHRWYGTYDGSADPKISIKMVKKEHRNDACWQQFFQRQRYFATLAERAF